MRPQRHLEANAADQAMMQRALDLAARGIGLVSPNPLVGCVITDANGDVIGEGFYRKDEVTHAEVLALQQAGERARDGTAYVSLEPHDHQGQTSPCTDALINAGIARVVCPIDDPNPLVSGRGFKKHRDAGVEVVTGVLADEARRQNEKFICWHEKQRPFVHLKLAMSLDGRISLGPSVSTALSGRDALRRVHELRHEHDAILVGGNTAAIDDPSLTDRSGVDRRRPLVRVVLDNSLQIRETSKLVTNAGEVPTLVFTNSRDEAKVGNLRAAGVEVIELEIGGRDLRAVLQELRNRELQSVLVEGGSEIAGAFVDAKLVDKVTFIYAPIIIGGRTAPNAIGGSGAESLTTAMKLTDIAIRPVGEDIELTGYPTF
ncbi:MAG: bifunctional diaminohydroxyphosphoribosylaminopyrimidine deaminase/5-amino-6-(5-phosphoribosylamino)uracil reductase RibD [Pyrinomonadaceae bacterium]